MSSTVNSVGDFDKAGYSKAVSDALRTSTNLGYSVRYDPTPKGNDLLPIQSVRPAPMKQWLVDSGDMITEVCNTARSMVPGDVRVLMASTSAGKTTKLPAFLAKQLGIAVLVLVPFISLAVRAKQRVESTVRSMLGVDLPVQLLANSHYTRPASVPSVYFSAAGEAMAMFCANRDLFRKLSVRIVIVDECHVKRPEYEMLLRMISAGQMKDIIVLFASATAASDISMESTNMRTFRFVPEGKMPFDPYDHQTTSPAHYSRVINRLLLVVGTDAEMDSWFDYYVANDVPCFTFGFRHGTRRQAEVDAFLAKHKLCVVVATSVVDTGYTFDIDDTVSNGYTSRMVANYSTGSLQLERVPVTASIQVQRAGRIGRIRPGVAWATQVECSSEIEDDNEDLCAYVNLWARLFRMEINEARISRFNALFDGLSDATVAALLTSAMPPLAMVQFFADDGLYAGWEEGYAGLRTCPGEVVSSTTPTDVELPSWKEDVYENASICRGELLFKTKVSVSAEFKVLLYHMWAHYNKYVDVSDARSARLTLYGGPTASRLRPQLKRIPTVSSMTSDGSASVDSKQKRSNTVYTYKSLASRFAPPIPSPIEEEEDTCSVVTDVKGKRVETPAPAYQPMLAKGHSRNPSFEVPYHSRSPPAFASDAEGSIARVMSWPRSMSSGSDIIDFTHEDLKEVDPEKYWNHDLYFMQPELFKTHVQNAAVGHRDWRRFNKLCAGTADFSSLSTDTDTNRDKQVEWAHSLLRVHKSCLVRMLQAKGIEGGSSKKRSFFGAIVPKSDSIAANAKTAARFLKMTTFVGVKYGIRKSSRHMSNSSDTSVQFGTRSRCIAAFALQVGPMATRQAIRSMASCAVPVVMDGHILAHGWTMNGLQFTVGHVFEENPGIAAAWADFEPPIDSGDRDLYRVLDEDSKHVAFRDPMDGERAYLVLRKLNKDHASSYGFARVSVLKDKYMLDEVYSSGQSGALVVAADDGYIIGMYLGTCIASGTGGASDFLNAMAIFK